MTRVPSPRKVMLVIVTINNVKTKVLRFRSFATHFVNKRPALSQSP